MKYSLVFTLAVCFASSASAETPEDFCIRTAGPQYVPTLDPSGNFNGGCEIASMNICLGVEYADPKTAATLCCDAPGMSVSKDGGKEGCCAAGQNFKWNPTAQTGTCVTPPPPPPPVPQVSCPGSAGQFITKNGIRWQIFCDRNVREYVPPWAVAGALFNIQSGPIGTETADSCLTKCAADPMCHGVNFWSARKQCGINNKPLGNPFKAGSRYELAPPSSNGIPCISYVSVPKR